MPLFDRKQAVAETEIFAIIAEFHARAAFPKIALLTAHKDEQNAPNAMQRGPPSAWNS